MPHTSTYQLTPIEKAVVDRAVAYVEGARDEPLTEQERGAMRAFLQRGETRLSTYQRVAGVFLNGAGLLVLLPAVARDTVQGVMLFGISSGWNSRVLVLVPWIISLGVPLWAFSLLLRDLVEFYFAPKFLAEDPVRITRFSLAGLSFPYDEGIEAKARVLALEASAPQYAQFVLSESKRARRGTNEAFQRSKSGGISYPMRLELRRRLTLNKSERSVDTADEELMDVALALAGSIDASLAEEVTRLEASLARHVLGLRRLVLRYSKALILFVWTTLVSLMVVALVSAENEQFGGHTKVAVLYAIYAAWALTSIILVRLPRRWIDSLAPSGTHSWARRLGLRSDERIQDSDIHWFEKWVTRILLISFVGFVALLVDAVVGNVQ